MILKILLRFVNEISGSHYYLKKCAVKNQATSQCLVYDETSRNVTARTCNDQNNQFWFFHLNTGTSQVEAFQVRLFSSQRNCLDQNDQNNVAFLDRCNGDSYQMWDVVSVWRKCYDSIKKKNVYKQLYKISHLSNGLALTSSNSAGKFIY